MKEIKDFFKDFADNNPWLIVFIGFCLLCFACNLFVEHTAIGKAIHEFNLRSNLK